MASVQWSQLEMLIPKNLSEALLWLSKDPAGLRPFAGGTDLMVLIESGRAPCLQYINILSLPELQGISEDPQFLRIGSTTTFSEIRVSPAIQMKFPLLAEAARHVGAYAIQNRATLGGNLANGSPAADSSPALLVYEARLELISSSGTRVIPYQEFHKGYKKMDLKPGELIQSILLPQESADTADGEFIKIGARAAQAISKVSFAGLQNPRQVCLALGAVAPYPIRLTKTEMALAAGADLAQVERVFHQEISPIDDIRSTAAYRREVAWRLVSNFLNRVKKKKGFSF